MRNDNKAKQLSEMHRDIIDFLNKEMELFNAYDTLPERSRCIANIFAARIMVRETLRAIENNPSINELIKELDPLSEEAFKDAKEAMKREE